MWGLAHTSTLRTRVTHVGAGGRQHYLQAGHRAQQQNGSHPGREESTAISPFVCQVAFTEARTHDRVRCFAVFHSNVGLARSFESNYRCGAGRPSRGADMATTADSAAITAQVCPLGRLEPVHAMNEARRCAKSARPAPEPASEVGELHAALVGVDQAVAPAGHDYVTALPSHLSVRGHAGAGPGSPWTTGERRRWDRRQDPGAHVRPGVLCYPGRGAPLPSPTRTGVRYPGALSCSITLACV